MCLMWFGFQVANKNKNRGLKSPSAFLDCLKYCKHFNFLLQILRIFLGTEQLKKSAYRQVDTCFNMLIKIKILSLPDRYHKGYCKALPGVFFYILDQNTDEGECDIFHSSENMATGIVIIVFQT